MHLPHPAPENVKVVLFADVAGSTQMYEQLGDNEALKRVQQCLDTMRAAATRFGGQVLKTIGDEVMCTFADPASAVYAASEMQSQVRALPQDQAPACMLRIGFHVGPVVQHDSDAFGATVNIASRITRLAKGGQILTSTSVVRDLPAALRLGIRVLNGMTLKARNDEIRLCEVLWDFSTDLTVIEQTPLNEDPPANVRLRLNDRIICAEDGGITFGRDGASTIRLEGPRASRHHARIEPRRDRFVLIDLSTNGTYLRMDADPAIRLTREECVLRGRGVIAFGDTPDADGVELIDYAIE